jgi:opacity protein-like surface antigen
MKNHIYILLLLLLLVPLISNAQRWKRTRYEVLGGIGPSLFFGDLGGADKDGQHFMSDIDMQSTRYHLMIGIRYKIKEKMALKLNLIYGRLHGSDKYTESGRTIRNVTMATGIFEPSVQFEYSILKERLGARYTFRNLSRFKLSYVNTYVFLGLGGLYFNPKPEYTNAKSNNQKKYSKFNLSIPLGLGFKYAINRRTCLGLEYGQRYTTTDYIDGTSQITPGNKSHDSYSFLTLSVTYKLKTARSGLPKF